MPFNRIKASSIDTQLVMDVIGDVYGLNSVNLPRK